MYGEKVYQLRLLRPLNNMETNTSEKENLQYMKQQTWFNWVCSWELMESAIILTPLALA